MGARSESHNRLAHMLGFDPPDELLSGEADDLSDVALALQEAATLQHAELPELNPAETDQLIAALTALVPAAESPAAGDLRRAWSGRRGWLAHTLATIQPQVRILSRSFWIASAALVAAGLPLLGAGQFGLPGTGLPGLPGADLTYGAFLVLIAPVLAILGVAHAFRSMGTGMAEMELACPLTPAQLILGRLFWVTAYDALLLGSASLLSAGLEPGIRLGWLVLAWLMPMLMLALLVLALSLYVPPRAGGGVALALWAAALVLLFAGRDIPLSAVTESPVALPLAVLCGAGAIVLAAGLAAGLPRLTARLVGGAWEVL